MSDPGRDTLHERGFTVTDLPDEEALVSLESIYRLLREAERAAQLLDGRYFDDARFREAYGLLALLYAKSGGEWGEEGPS